MVPKPLARYPQWIDGIAASDAESHGSVLCVHEVKADGLDNLGRADIETHEQACSSPNDLKNLVRIWYVKACGIAECLILCGRRGQHIWIALV